MNHKKNPLQIFVIVGCLLFITHVKSEGLVYPEFVEGLITKYLFTRDTIPTRKTLKSIKILLEDSNYSHSFIEKIMTELCERYENIETRFIGLDHDIINSYFLEANKYYERPLFNEFIRKFKESKVLNEATFFNAMILKKTMELFLNIKKMRQSKPFYSNLPERLNKRFKKTFRKLSPKSDLMHSIASQLNTLAISTDFFRENSWKFPEMEKYFNSFMSYLNDSEKYEFQKLLRLELRKSFPEAYVFVKILSNQDTTPQQIISLYHILQNTYFKNAEIKNFLSEIPLNQDTIPMVEELKFQWLDIRQYNQQEYFESTEIKMISNEDYIRKQQEFIQTTFIEATFHEPIELNKRYQEGNEYIKELAYCRLINSLLAPKNQLSINILLSGLFKVGPDIFDVSHWNN